MYAAKAARVWKIAVGLTPFVQFSRTHIPAHRKPAVCFIRWVGTSFTAGTLNDIFAGCDSNDGDKTPGKVVKPSAAPSGGAVVAGTTVTLSTSTEGAAVYYTIDGGTPTGNSTEYATPIPITEAITINAIAIKEGMADSDILTASYAVATYTVTFNSNGGSAVAPITNGEHGATISAPEQQTSGYGTFVGWHGNTALTNLFNFDATSVTSNITLYAKWTAAYELGDTGPGGGKTYYRSETGFTVHMRNSSQNHTAFYLEAAPENLRRSNNMETLRWCNCNQYHYAKCQI